MADLFSCFTVEDGLGGGARLTTDTLFSDMCHVTTRVNGDPTSDSGRPRKVREWDGYALLDEEVGKDDDALCACTLHRQPQIYLLGKRCGG